VLDDQAGGVEHQVGILIDDHQQRRVGWRCDLQGPLNLVVKAEGAQPVGDPAGE